MSAFASGKYAYGFCDVCSFRVKLTLMRDQIFNQRKTGVRVCPTCYDQDNPQLQVGKRPVFDPQSLRNPRPDNALEASRQLTGPQPYEPPDVP